MQIYDINEVYEREKKKRERKIFSSLLIVPAPIILQPEIKTVCGWFEYFHLFMDAFSAAPNVLIGIRCFLA